jgi:cobalamin-dependent methionine synthase I
MKLKFLHSIPVSVSADDLIDDIRNDKRHPVSKRIRNDTKNAVKEVNRLINAKAVYKEIPITSENGSVTLDEDINIRSKRLNYVLRSCDKAVVFIVTIGSEVEEMIERKMKSQPHYGYLLDAAASLAAEAAAEYVNDLIVKNMFNDGEQTTLRYSPGYCDWPLTEQKKLFKILLNDEIDIQLSDQCLMSPRKSISAIIGISSNGSQGFIKNICKICNRYDCPYRRTS